MQQALPNKVTGGRIEAVSDVPDVLLEQAKADFQGFYGRFQQVLENAPELRSQIRDAWDGEIPATVEDFYNSLRFNTDVDPPIKRNWHTTFKQSFLMLTITPMRELGEAFGWEPSIRFTVRELAKRHQVYIQGGAGGNVGIAGWNIARVALTELSGFIDPKTGEELMLCFVKERIANKTDKLVTWDTIFRLPDTLIAEIVIAANDAMGLTEEEVADVDFTQPSASTSSAPSTAPNPAKTKLSAPTCAETAESPAEKSE